MSALNSLMPGTAVTPAHTLRVQNALVGVSYGGLRPPLQSVGQLSTDLARVLPGRNIPLLNTSQLARDLEVVMNGSRQTGIQIQYAIGSAQNVMHGSGVPRQGILTLTSDMRAVASWGRMANMLAQIP
jgi:hypothetical protein